MRKAVQEEEPTKEEAAPHKIETKWWIVLGALLVIVAGCLAYSNSFSGPFVLDDRASINSNPSIRSLWPITQVLNPPLQLSVSGRPVANLTFAVNYAIGGTDVTGYHVLNLIVHLCAALVLCGVVRRTLLTPALKERFGEEALPLALAVTLLWTLHPLQTASVTYVIQRIESISTFFYLLTTYCALRGFGGGRSIPWMGASVVACFLGVGAKEVMVSAPVIVLAYDRTFIAASFKEAIKKRWGYYLCLASSWFLLGYLIFSTGSRWGTAGAGTGVMWWEYGMTQLVAVTRYLGLVFWPSPLVFDYGYNLVRDWKDAILYAPPILGLLAGTAYAFWKHPPIGFLGVLFLAVMAPTSSVIPIKTQTMSEHRMYLPLATIIAFVIIGGWHLCKRYLRGVKPFGREALVFYAVVSIAAIAFGGATFARNRDYSTALSLWLDTIEESPNNARAHYWAAKAYHDLKNYGAAIDHYKTSMMIDPHSELHHIGLGNLYVDLVRIPEAIEEFRLAYKYAPTNLFTLSTLGSLLMREGRAAEAASYLDKAGRISKGDPHILRGLAMAYAASGDLNRAIPTMNLVISSGEPPLFVYMEFGGMLESAGRKREAFDVYSHVQRTAEQRGDYQMAGQARLRLASLR